MKWPIATVDTAEDLLERRYVEYLRMRGYKVEKM